MHQYDLKHFPEVYSERLVYAKKVQERVGGDIDSTGMQTSFAISDSKFFGTLDYVMKEDIASFRSKQAEAAALKLSMINRFNVGEPIDPSFLSMMNYQDLFNALASGDMELARALSAVIGGRDALEEHFSHPFTIAFGYLLKSFVDNAGENEKRHWIEEFRKHHAPNYEGYTLLFEAILEEDIAKGETALKQIIKGHKKESKGSGMFAGTEEQFLSVWGIGMANLARSYGVMVDIDDPLIPHELLV